jgi:hypothetical protein
VRSRSHICFFCLKIRVCGKRQYGKTTTLFLLNNNLKVNENYLPIKISFEGIGDLIFEQEQSFSQAFLQILGRNLLINNESLATFWKIMQVKLKI